MLTNTTKRSDSAIALWRCAARRRRIDALGITAEMLENPFDDCQCPDAGDDTQVPAALPAGFDVDGKYALEALYPIDSLVAANDRKPDSPRFWSAPPKERLSIKRCAEG